MSIQVSVTAVIKLPSGVTARSGGPTDEIVITEPGSRGGSGKAITIPGREWEALVRQIDALREAFTRVSEDLRHAAEPDNEVAS